ncbi:MAG: hypothetical protein A3G79_02305 [Gallionellales bacterium RIFCSPLOWO2_12_FULL_57_18]|nr:MAG: hypothetical protein A3G79_02305 [Gallionellales bacterium RIFCSPLOWO2_12_FULL_57_18]OGS97311.1 MAG: hypothetical protein A3H31_05125 [Gallionellales bacterium RIFCSPLOWO2_02_FULL_57_47]OGT16355.1 MAG: hypothetical protein A3J49_14365 [Gallionellales bacterium RIFCSPHIGHO2_02_FULL_57_16]
MRILLVYSNQSRELEPAPPVGLSYVASATRAAGHEVKLLDLVFARDLLGELTAGIRAFKPDVVGLSIRNIDNVISQRYDSPLKSLLEQVAVIRANALTPDGQPVPLVLGGPAVSILAEKALTVFGADYAVVGEGETAFPMLLEALEKNASLVKIPGLCYSKEGKPARNQTTLLPAFAQSGMQQWISWKPYQRGGGTWPIQTKRGCPMSCIYCAYPLVEGKHCRLREPGEVVDEIEQVLRDVRPRTFEFVDSTFNVPASHAKRICEEIIRRGVKANFTAMGVNPRDVPADLFPLMKRAGFNSVMITAEAGCDSMLKNYCKGFTMQEVNSCLEHASASGLKSMWFFMLGGPGETMDSCEETIRFVETRLAGRQFFTVFFTGIRILPGTVLARQAIEGGYISADTDFSEGVFYLSPELDEQSVIDRINRAIVRNPCIVHAADGNASKQQHLLYSTLSALGVAPPYWRYIPEMLLFPPLRYLRDRYPSAATAGIAEARERAQAPARD